MSKKIKWTVEPSESSMRTFNPIRNIVDKIDLKEINNEKAFIPLSIGDPAVFGNFNPSKEVVESVKKTLEEGKHNGYAPSTGFNESKEALAKRYSNAYFKLKNEDVFITSGCSGAIEIALGALLNPDENVLIPKPGFSLYATVCSYKGIEPRYYNLLPDKNWEADLDHMSTLVDEKTKAIVINNPSNPCGSVYTKKHILELLKFASTYKIPILADEIYADMVFSGSSYYSMSEVLYEYNAKNKNKKLVVPILSVGGIAKQFLVPGWRLGWILVYDDFNVFKKLRTGLLNLTTVILGANTLMQGSLKKIFNDVPKDYYKDLNQKLESNSRIVVEGLSDTYGLKIIEPKGAMYCMVGIDLKKFSKEITDDIVFSKMLLKEQSVFVLPGQCFQMKNYFRIVVCPPKDKLVEACKRIKEFCKKYSKE